MPGPDPYFDVSDRLFVVTGAAGGLGRELARSLAGRGARLALTDLDSTGLHAGAAELGGDGDRVLTQAADCTDEAAVEAFVAATEARLGPIDVLVNCAAVGCHTPPHDLSAQQWREVLDVDLTGYFLLSRAVARTMIRDRRAGCIVNVSSIAATTAIGRGNVAYSVAKAGVNQLTRELALEWSAYGIRVNAVQPSQIATPSFLDLLDTGAVDLARAAAGIPLGRIARPDEVIGPIVFLASDAAAFVTGVVLPVDGGNLAMNAGGTRPVPP